MTSAEAVDCNPPYLHPEYKNTILRSPRRPLIELPDEWFHHVRGPAFGRIPVRPGDNDLTKQHAGRPIGQFIVLSGRVLDSRLRPVPNTLVEIWQANGAGRYVDKADPGLLPLDPNFTGAGRTLTDADGRYRFRTIRPGAYPAKKRGLYRPAHIHFSLFGPDVQSRIVTQCYFEGDPLIAYDPIAQAIPDPRGIDRLTARLDWEGTEPGDVDAALSYEWDIVLRGLAMTPSELVR
ncbi:dioxygenase family protein [Amycolatopsis pithecellobii]|uniref:Protocatechuate 3,4-dioxygenase subunit beta n=1 Tax=Amycolatopsis pithecellobii TaxID=664692 RepID=A0A6N7YHU4_9PSEU|nr:protocatechuate 3,4-dioxygenase subunit beta [Amycolatopsis pithecellobii]MTD52467.1 protocatechuate 3,4-dioxygenase subunit beta [Amycolatopsis pithecellobii]